MAIARRNKHAGRPDINAQFTRQNIRKTLADYKKIKKRNGDYTFGGLTAKFYRFNSEATEAWEGDIADEYPKDAQDEIKRHIIHALTHRNERGRADPIPLTIKWGGGKRGVVATYDPSGPSYTIEIMGYLSPAAAAIAARRRARKS